MSQTMKTRPSTLLGVVDPYVAFCVDRACWVFASTIEDEQNKAEARLPDNAKSTAHTRARQRVLDQFLGVEPAEEKGRFRNI